MPSLIKCPSCGSSSHLITVTDGCDPSTESVRCQNCGYTEIRTRKDERA